MKKRYIILLTTLVVSIVFFMSISLYFFTSIFVTDFNHIDQILNPLSPKDSVSNQQVVTIQNEELLLTGYLSTSNSSIYVLVVHGYGGSGLEMDWAVKAFLDMGYNVLSIDLQGHGQSDGEVTGLGTLEQTDIVAWSHYIKELDNNSQIILYGVSMGATTILNALDDNLPTNVQVVIEDSGYTSTKELFSYHLTETFSLPKFPFLFLMNLFTQLYLHIDIQLGPIQTIESNTIPILYIHGTHDTYVPYQMGQTLYETSTSIKELYLIQDAGHVAGNEVDEAYWDVIRQFIEENLVY